jgi:hypothetical protein
VFIPEPLIVRHPVPYGPELRRDEAIAAFSTMPLLGHEAGIEQDAEVLRDGRPAHVEMSRKRVDGVVGLDKESVPLCARQRHAEVRESGPLGRCPSRSSIQLNT